MLGNKGVESVMVMIFLAIAQSMIAIDHVHSASIKSQGHASIAWKLIAADLVHCVLAQAATFVLLVGCCWQTVHVAQQQCQQLCHQSADWTLCEEHGHYTKVMNLYQA